LDILEYKYLIITQPEKSIEFLVGKLGALAQEDEAEVEKKPKVKKAVKQEK
jgi:hypothetical protein